MAATFPHVLHLRSPACELLCNDGSLPILPEPAFAEYRARPPRDRALLHSFGTDFHVVLSSSSHEQVLSELLNLGQLFDAINVLCYIPGESELQHVEGKLALDDSYWKHGFRLVTMQDGVVVNTQEWTLAFVEVLELEEPQYRNVPWIATFLHLTERRSDMACYHAEEQMLTVTDADHVEAGIEQYDWDTNPSRTAHQYLLNKFIDDHGYPPSMLYAVGLRCQHWILCTWEGFEKTDLEGILALCCPICDVPLLTDIEMHEIMACDQNTNSRRAFLELNSQWSTLNSRPAGSDVFPVYPKALCAAIELALASLSPPSLILPAEMSMAATEETAEVMRRLRGLCSELTSPLSTSPSDLVSALEQQIWETPVSGGKTLGQVFLRPGYVEFVQKWCCRAVNFLVHCRCDKVGPQHVGLHLHETRQVYNPAVWMTVDELGSGLDKLALGKPAVDATHDHDMDL
ncbi:hypothetical protein CB0940_06394 [Cercospora beticola]|uniref:Uncharacterized protein n=1 Tax=Cercospora beticola TaxID=122368 RepID=A0A2G5I0D2_CERBT|nr:hypothetical protein CB0940_06394 [Cercospora beticola]PIA98265.1 hypothetical protein CB0940_06394 [Cercospora beticola]WPA99025.1 hypothetical protein RHO25_003639 [Cercospora beticola]CAK1360331.1 unnamed protein product [Cercospora beticola]